MKWTEFLLWECIAIVRRLRDNIYRNLILFKSTLHPKRRCWSWEGNAVSVTFHSSLCLSFSSTFAGYRLLFWCQPDWKTISIFLLWTALESTLAACQTAWSCQTNRKLRESSVPFPVRGGLKDPPHPVKGGSLVQYPQRATQPGFPPGLPCCPRSWLQKQSQGSSDLSEVICHSRVPLALGPLPVSTQPGHWIWA